MIALVDAAEGLAVSLGGCFVISVFRAARMLDDDRAAVTAKAEGEIESKQSVIVGLQADIDAAKAQPKLSAFEQAQRTSLQEKLKDWADQEKDILRFLLQHEEQDRGQLVRAFGDTSIVDAVTSKGNRDGIVQYVRAQGQHTRYRIVPTFVEALKVYFHGG